MQKRLNLCKTIVEIVKNSVGVVGRVKLFLLALFFLFHTTTFAYFPICCGCFLAFLVVAYPDISFFAFFGVHSCLPHTLCFIFFLFFSGCVPRYFIFRFFRGTFLSFSYIMFHIFLAFWWSRTPTFHFSPFSGYISVFLIHYVSYFPCFLVVAYPDISFFIFLWVRTFSYITYCGFSTLLFTENVPRHFIFNISLGTLLNCLTYFPPPLCTKGYRVALASTRYPSTNSLTFYIHISIYLYSHFYISIFILTACLFASPLAYGYFSLQ